MQSSDLKVYEARGGRGGHGYLNKWSYLKSKLLGLGLRQAGACRKGWDGVYTNHLCTGHLHMWVPVWHMTRYFSSSIYSQIHSSLVNVTEMYDVLLSADGHGLIGVWGSLFDGWSLSTRRAIHEGRK